MKDTIQDNKFVELTYQVTDAKTNEILVQVEFPLGYVHGSNQVLEAAITNELRGKSVGDKIDLSIDCNQLYGPRDESLVFTDHIENVPEAYREVGMTITMENEKGEPKDFLVTRVDEKTLTVDGNNPLCGREVIFMLEVLSIRDATEEEIVVGGAVDAEPSLEEILH